MKNHLNKKIYRNRTALFFPECLISWSYPATIPRIFQQGSGKQQVFGIFDSWDYFLRHHFW